jgi:predicted dehydrogenase
MDFEDHALCSLKFKEGPVAAVNVGWFSKTPHMSMELYGTVDHASVTRFRSSAFDIVMDGVRKKLGKIGHSFEGYYNELHYFVECLRSGATPSPSGDEGLEDLKIVSQAYENSVQFNS